MNQSKANRMIFCFIYCPYREGKYEAKIRKRSKCLELPSFCMYYRFNILVQLIWNNTTNAKMFIGENIILDILIKFNKEWNKLI